MVSPEDISIISLVGLKPKTKADLQAYCHLSIPQMQDPLQDYYSYLDDKLNYDDF